MPLQQTETRTVNAGGGPQLWRPEAFLADAGLDERAAAMPDRPAVFVIHPRAGKPYLGKSARIARRLNRLLGRRTQPSKRLNLREVAERVEYQFTASWLEMHRVYYEVARLHYPDDYRSIIRLRMPPYIKAGLSNAFPRCYVSTRLGGSRGFWFGPFRGRASAEQFLNRVSDLFQVRRCYEDLTPSPDHPGCIYGEMNLCLRPCQQVVGPAEYASEVARAVEFLSTGGRSLLDTVTRARDRLSQEMQFEEAARLHRQLDKIQEVLRLRDDLARDIDRLHGVAVTRSLDEGAVELWFMLAGCWQAPVRFRVEAEGEKTESLDKRLHGIVAALQPMKLPSREREDHLALLARWYYSSYRDGEWLAFESPADVSYRKLVHAISRVARG